MSPKTRSARLKTVKFAISLIVGAHYEWHFAFVFIFTLQKSYDFVAVTILLAMSVYQIIVSNRLPASSDSVPVIGKFDG